MAALEGDKDTFKRISSKIERLGHSLITDHYLVKTINELKNESETEAEGYAKSAFRWLKAADIVIVDVTVSNVSVGYELSLALSLMKPVIVLYDAKKSETPHSLRGVASDRLQLLEYTSETLEQVVEDAIEYAGQSNDIRFNFFISPTIGQYLDWISTYKKIPRSVYLRNLIEKDMLGNPEYSDLG